MASCGSCRQGHPDFAEPITTTVEALPPTLPPLTIAEAATREQVSTRTVHRWIEAGDLSPGAWKVGTRWRIDPAALDRLRARGPVPRPRRAPTGGKVAAADVATPAAGGLEWPR